MSEVPTYRPGDVIGGHPDPLMRRAERGVVRGLAAEYGKGQQVQTTLRDRIEIGVGGVVVTIRFDDEPPSGEQNAI